MPMGGPGHMSRWIAMWTIFFRWHCPVSKSGSPSSRRVFEVPSIDVEGIFGTKNKRRIYVLEKQVAEKDQMRLRILKKAFSVIDNAIFGGIVNIGNPKLHQTDLAGYDYLLFNFNDYPNGMVTLFNLLVMGIWSPLMQSYKELTGTSWTYVYFFSFYLIAVLWLLNLIVVFVLEAFQAEMNLEASTRSVDGDGKEERREQRRPVGFMQY